MFRAARRAARRACDTRPESARPRRHGVGSMPYRSIACAHALARRAPARPAHRARPRTMCCAIDFEEARAAPRACRCGRSRRCRARRTARDVRARSAADTRARSRSRRRSACVAGKRARRRGCVRGASQRMQPVPALDLARFARELGEARHAADLGGDVPVVRAAAPRPRSPRAGSRRSRAGAPAARPSAVRAR